MDEDLHFACEELRKIEKDLAFDTFESYEDGHVEDFRDALLTLRLLVQVVRSLCSDLH